MNKWSYLPKEKLQNAGDTEADYVVLAPNPYFINRVGSNNQTPPYKIAFAMWDGTNFRSTDDFQIIQTNFYIKLPKYYK